MLIDYNTADPSAEVQIRRITPQDTVALRHTVLWPDKPVSYVLLPEDDSGHHFGAFLPAANTPLAVISLFIEQLPTDRSEAETAGTDDSQVSSPKVARFRKFACDLSHQGRGIGSALLKYTFKAAKEELGCWVIWCDARMETAPWYEKRGMVRFGELFYKGPIEYVRMKADL